MKAQLIKPIKDQHRYVVGIDFGHGESSAAICSLEWETSAGHRENKEEDIDMDINARKKVIPSAICIMPDESMFIGDEAFEHLTDNNGFRLSFKQKPVDISGENEVLMMKYMKAIYARIRESRQELTDDNHIVYIARPSGWVDNGCKDLYCQMALKAGIPLAGLTSESRAAIFYARNKETFANDISQGGIVFDLGSSTLDFTYLAEDNKPIDFGYDIGASKIDKAILENMILSNPDVKEFISNYPEYRDALEFRARKFKEEAYSRNESSPTNSGFPLCNIIPEQEASYDKYQDTYVKLRIKNLEELNSMVEKEVHYMELLRNAMQDFKDNHIPEKTVNGVFLTGGASRMNFIRPIISEVFSLPIEKIKTDNDNPSLTISRGIALLGTTDAITTVLVEELRRELPQIISRTVKIDNLIETLASDVESKAWSTIEDSCHRWIISGTSTNTDELKEWLENDVNYFKNHRVSSIVNNDIHYYLKQGSEEILKKMNEIIRRYAPSREIKLTGTVDVGQISAINESLGDLSTTLSQIVDSITDVVSDALWVALGIFLWGIFALPYYFIKAIRNAFRSDDEVRRRNVNKLLEKKYEICSGVGTKVRSMLNDNSNFKSTLVRTFSDYYTKQMEANLQQVIIPIE